MHATGGLRHPLAMVPGVFGMAVSALVFTRALLRYGSATVAVRSGTTVMAPVGMLAVAVAASLLSISGLLVVVVLE